MPPDPRAHLAVRAAVFAGVLPAVTTRGCTDCAAPARYYHHDHGYAPEHWLTVVPVCGACHRRRHPRPRTPREARSSLTIILPNRVLAGLREAADDERRSLTATLVVAAEAWLRQRATAAETRPAG